MTDRLIIKEELNNDWLEELNGASVELALEILRKFPMNAILTINWHGYDGADGVIETQREETDEEYKERKEAEAEEIRIQLQKKFAKEEKERLNRQKEIADLKERLAKLEGRC